MYAASFHSFDDLEIDARRHPVADTMARQARGEEPDQCHLKSHWTVSVEFYLLIITIPDVNRLHFLLLHQPPSLNLDAVQLR